MLPDCDRDGVMIADGTRIAWDSARHSWQRFVLVVSPAYRGRGLGYSMLAELIEIAQTAGIERLEAEIVSGAQTAAVEAIEQFGFQQVARIQGHLRGPTGEAHDLTLYVFDLGEED